MSDRDKIIEVLARYARALEDRNAEAIAALFAPDGTFELFSRHGRDEYVAQGTKVVGRDNIRAMIESGSMPPGRGMHYLTGDHIVDIIRDEASLQAQFVAVESNTDIQSQSKWTVGASMLQGAFALTMVGRYESRLCRIEGRWLFTVHRVKHSLPLTTIAAQR
jgi:hypothetical protein